MRLIVGLGNPGPEYEWTPHNLGFLAVDFLARRVMQSPDRTFYEKTFASYFARVNKGSKPARWRSFKRAMIEQGFLAGREIVVAKPTTYMNESGRAVQYLMVQFNIEPKDLVVVSDDFALPWGELRIKTRGSAGGHNGLKSIIDALSTEHFPRVRVGVRPENAIGDLSTYVLKPIAPRFRNFAAQMASIAADSVESIVKDGQESTMARFNNIVFLPEE
jgi:peptidyl-tRNA hydrolase, PTH1 family